MKMAYMFLATLRPLVEVCHISRRLSQSPGAVLTKGEVVSIEEFETTSTRAAPLRILHSQQNVDDN